MLFHSYVTWCLNWPNYLDLIIILYILNTSGICSIRVTLNDRTLYILKVNKHQMSGHNVDENRRRRLSVNTLETLNIDQDRNLLPDCVTSQVATPPPIGLHYIIPLARCAPQHTPNSTSSCYTFYVTWITVIGEPFLGSLSLGAILISCSYFSGRYISQVDILFSR